TQLVDQRRAPGVVVGDDGQASGGKVDEDVQLVLGDVDADDGSGGTIVLHGGVPALRMRTAPPGARRVQPAVRVSTTRPAAIPLRDGVRRGDAGARSSYPRAPPGQ